MTPYQCLYLEEEKGVEKPRFFQLWVESSSPSYETSAFAYDRWEPLWASCVFGKSQSSKAISHVVLGADLWSPAGWASASSPLAAASWHISDYWLHPVRASSGPAPLCDKLMQWEMWEAFARQNRFASEGTEASNDPSDKRLERLTVFLSSLSFLAATLTSMQTRACS